METRWDRSAFVQLYVSFHISSPMDTGASSSFSERRTQYAEDVHDGGTSRLVAGRILQKLSRTADWSNSS